MGISMCMSVSRWGDSVGGPVCVPGDSVVRAFQVCVFATLWGLMATSVQGRVSVGVLRGGQHLLFVVVLFVF